MRHCWKALVMSVALLFSMGTMAACGTGASEGQTTIRFWYTATISENRIVNEMIDAYNEGQGKEDGVFVEGDNRQNIDRTALYSNPPSVLMISDEEFKTWALEGLFTDLTDYYESDPGSYSEDGIPDALTNTFRIDKEVGANGIRMAGEGADLQALPFGATPMVYFYSLPAFEDQGINIISVAEEELNGTGEYAEVQPPGFSKLLVAPHPVKGLPTLHAEYESVKGKIVSSYCQKDGKIRYEITIPEGVEGEIVLPGEAPLKVTGGEYTFERESEELFSEPYTPESTVLEVFDNPKAVRAFNEVFGGIFTGHEIAWMKNEPKTLQFMAEFRDMEKKMKLSDFPAMLVRANEIFKNS